MIRKAKSFADMKFKLGDTIQRIKEGDREINFVTRGKIYEVKDIFAFYKEKKFGLPNFDLVCIKDDRKKFDIFSSKNFMKITPPHNGTTSKKP